MPDANDMDLVGEYARHNSEPAFSELVQRHIGLVYSVALRFTRNPPDAQDVAQAVFVILARKAAGLRAGTILTGWLYETTRLTSLQWVRNQARRQNREQEAHMQYTLDNSNPDSVWRQVEPLLEQAMSRLNEKDRTLLALRFFENRSSPETAAILGIGEWAVRKRAERALGKLRDYFAKRGVASATAIIAGAMSANSVQAAPAGLAQTISAVAVAKGAAASTSTLTLVKGALNLMAWTKAKTAIVGVAAALLVIGGGKVAVNAIAAARSAAALATMKGSWEGTFDDGSSFKARVVFTIFQTNGGYRAKLASIDQGIEIPIPNLWANSHRIYAAAPAVPFNYRATLNSDGTIMTGTVKAQSTTAALVLNRTAVADAVLTLSPEQYARRPDSPLQGEWAGTLKYGGDSYRVILRIAETAPGTFEAVLDAPGVSNGGNIRASSLVFHPPIVSFNIGVGGNGFQGDLNTTGNELAGTLTWGNEKLPLKFECVQTNTQAIAESEKDYQGGYFQIQGHWKGTVRLTQAAWAGKSDVRFGFNIAQMPDGSYSATLDVPDQGAQGATAIPATSVDWTYPNIRIEWKHLGGAFTGKLENGRLSGTWHQGKDALAIQLKRAS